MPGARARAATAEDRPLACLVDDAQWLDRATVQCLAFAARRLLADSVAMIFAVRQRDDHDELASLPGLTVTGLGDADARTLLASAVGGRLDAEVRDRIVAETGGNPPGGRPLVVPGARARVGPPAGRPTLLVALVCPF